jgi:hypothetical protein
MVGRDVTTVFNPRRPVELKVGRQKSFHGLAQFSFVLGMALVQSRVQTPSTLLADEGEWT